MGASAVRGMLSSAVEDKLGSPACNGPLEKSLTKNSFLLPLLMWTGEHKADLSSCLPRRSAPQLTRQLEAMLNNEPSAQELGALLQTALPPTSTGACARLRRRLLPHQKELLQVLRSVRQTTGGRQCLRLLKRKLSEAAVHEGGATSERRSGARHNSMSLLAHRARSNQRRGASEPPTRS